MGIEEAEIMALAAHEGQLDKAGAPYIDHVAWVAQAVKEYGQDAQIVGLLHDAVEDGGANLAEIRWNFGDAVANAVDAISRRDGENYSAYLQRVARNRIAYQVKIADMKHNAMVNRYQNPGPAEYVKCAQYMRRIGELMAIRRAL